VIADITFREQKKKKKKKKKRYFTDGRLHPSIADPKRKKGYLASGWRAVSANGLDVIQRCGVEGRPGRERNENYRKRVEVLLESNSPPVNGAETYVPNKGAVSLVVSLTNEGG